ncbi:DUF2796 domain-containing protein [Thiomicrorhabdus sp.]|uniref:ZrgA family zinc uptake protein n=1 Tax=Thiomicrorhabdus sp. TaxID=2039724 RepID=UPI0029C91B64|nr:DUF2796 domain-containing protein [Thiomicrorhabdus sp.]
MSRSSLIPLLLLFVTPVFADDDHHHHHEHGAHEHGIAEMDIAIAGKQLMIDLESPAHNLLGFEHAPQTKQQKTLFEQKRQQLRKGAPFILPQAAGCRLVEREDNLDELLHKTGGHSDLDFEWQFECADTTQLNVIDAKPLFASWPHLMKLRVEWLRDSVQSAQTLDEHATELRLTSE